MFGQLPELCEPAGGIVDGAVVDGVVVDGVTVGDVVAVNDDVVVGAELDAALATATVPPASAPAQASASNSCLVRLPIGSLPSLDCS